MYITGIYTLDNYYNQFELDQLCLDCFNEILGIREEMDDMWAGEYSQSVSHWQ